MNEHQYLHHRLYNALHTGLLLLAMVALLGTLGWMLLGGLGVILPALIGLMVLTMTPNLSTAMSMRILGARPIHPHDLAVVHQMLGQLSKRAELAQVPKLYLLPGHEINAFAMGSGNDTAIAVSSGLLRRLDRREIFGVLAHEVSHLAMGDTRILSMAALAGRMTRGLSLFGMIMLVIYLPLVLTQHVHFPVMLIALLVGAPMAVTWLQMALSRTREFAADMKAASLTGDPRGLASALNTLEMSRGGGFFERLFAPAKNNQTPEWLRSHPDTRERIRRLLEVQTQPVRYSLPHATVLLH